ncbi:MAG TPA: hypothetical protein VJ398_05040 [Acidimicrobiia bacterium]|nr:hypothetical protein [Acidimicrobiia bacterium]
MGSPFMIGSTTPIASITWRRAGRRTVVPDIPLPPLTSTSGWKTQNGRVAAYGLFWFDLITGVELVEPMRTEEKYGRLGLVRH